MEPRTMTSRPSALWISEAEVTSLLDVGAAMAALEQGLRMEAGGEATNMTKTHVAWSGGNLHAIGASFTAAGIVGTKTWAFTPKG
jgi:alanine dehydrogenase